jgi:hemolysin activation/secretion protein
MPAINKTGRDLIPLTPCEASPWDISHGEKGEFFSLSLKSLFIKLLISCVLLVIFNTDAKAAQSGDEEALKDIERKQFEIERKLREKEKIEKEAEEEKEEKEKVSPEEAENRFLIKEVEIQNSEILSNREKDKLVAPFLNKEIAYNDINALVGKVTNTLMEKGYITARVKVPLGQNLMSGKLLLTIVNGYIEDIVPDKEGIRRKMQLFSAFPFFKGKLLNINDLDYGIEQMNRLGSNNATMKIIPGEKLGASKIMIFNDPGNMLNLETGIDNLGQKSTSEYRRKISAGLDNLVSLNDSTLLTYTDGKNSDTDRKYSRVYTMYFAFPLGYWMFSSAYSRSEYMQHIKGNIGEFKSSGNDTTNVFSIDRLLWRQKLDRVKLKSSLTLKNKETFLADIKIDTSSRKLTVVKIGLDYSSFLFGGYFSVGADYNRGLDMFGAKKDASGMSEDTPRAQFNMYKMDLYWNKPFNILNQGFAYNISFSGQYGMESLYNTEQMSIGDLYTVRGFKNSSTAGDRGYLVRNELSVNDFSRFWKYLKGLKLFAGYDYGYVINKIGKEANNGTGEATLTGIASGLNYYHSLCNISFTYGRKLRSPGFIKEKEHVIYCIFNINLTNIFDETWNLVSKKENNEDKVDKKE